MRSMNAQMLRAATAAACRNRKTRRQREYEFCASPRQPWQSNPDPAPPRSPAHQKNHPAVLASAMPARWRKFPPARQAITIRCPARQLPTKNAARPRAWSPRPAACDRECRITPPTILPPSVCPIAPTVLPLAASCAPTRSNKCPVDAPDRRRRQSPPTRGAHRKNHAWDIDTPATWRGLARSRPEKFAARWPAN